MEIEKIILINVINNWDPINLLSIAPSDEYEFEISQIYDRLPNIQNVNDLANLIYTVFKENFEVEFKKKINDCMLIAEEIYKYRKI